MKFNLPFIVFWIARQGWAIRQFAKVIAVAMISHGYASDDSTEALTGILVMVLESAISKLSNWLLKRAEEPPKTDDDAIRKIQEIVGVRPDGVVGPETREQLFKLISPVAVGVNPQ